MDVALRRVVCVLAVAQVAAAVSAAGDPPGKAPAGKVTREYADPRATYRSYIEAVRKHDLHGAKQCWVIDDDNKSGALDTIVGLWISTRRLNQEAGQKFGADGLEAILKGWRRDDVSDQALDRTKQRVEDAEVKFDGDHARLTIKWAEADGGSSPAFMFSRDPVLFRSVDGNWKIDANGMTGLKRGADFFEKGTWGPMFRDQVAIMNAAVDGMGKGELKTAKDLGGFIEDRVAAMRKKYEEEAGRAVPKGK